MSPQAAQTGGGAEQKLDSPQITGAPVDQSSLRASERVCSENPWIQPNAANPLRNEARILMCCHAVFGTTTTCEQELAGPFVGGLQIIIDRPAGLFAQFESDRPSGLLLSDRCAIRRVSARSDILDFDCNDVTSTKLAVDRQIEHGKVPSATFDLKFRPDRPDVFGSQRRLCSSHLAFVPRHLLGRRRGSVHSSVAEEENHVRLVTALKSGWLSGERGLGMRSVCERRVANDLNRTVRKRRHARQGASAGGSCNAERTGAHRRGFLGKGGQDVAASSA